MTTALVKVVVKAVAVGDVEMAAAVVVAAHKPHVETAVVMVAVVAAAMAADAVVNTKRLARKVHVVPKAMAAEVVAVRAADAHRWVTHNRAATKADLAAAWASALPVPRRVVNPILCVPVSI